MVVRLVDFWRCGEYSTAEYGEDKDEGGKGLASLEFVPAKDRARHRAKGKTSSSLLSLKKDKAETNYAFLTRMNKEMLRHLGIAHYPL